MDIHFILLLAGIILAETSAQFFIQKRVENSSNIFLLLGIVLYGVVATLYYLLLRKGEKMAVANSLWNAGTEITIALLGFFFFGQKLTKKQVVGLILTIIGINLLG